MATTFEPELRGVRDLGVSDEGFRRLAIDTARGVVATRLTEAPGECAVILVGGVGGGFDSPARGLYGRLATLLGAEGVSTLRLRYRLATQLPEAVHDLRAGIAYLEKRGARRIALVGHSFGGAVVIQAAADTPSVVSVVALSTQSVGTELTPSVAPRPLLLIHGANDTVIPPACSEWVHDLAHPPKEIRILLGANHALDEVADDVFTSVFEWLRRSLTPAAALA